LSGCAAPDDPGKELIAIREGGDYQDWDAVRPALRAYLLEHPEDFVAHYLYGLSFLHLGAPQLTFAEGEFLTAQTLLSKTEEFPEDVAGMSREQFTGRLHLKSALVYMRGLREAIQMGLPESYRQNLLEKANEQVEIGLKS